jgi:IS30 family transposase
MSSYTHFTLKEREYLQELLDRQYSIRKIAHILGRSPSSVSREIKRNRTKKGYQPWHAQTNAIHRRREHCQRCLKPDTEEWDYILEHLQKYWSPEAICGRWALEHPEAKPLHHSTMYRYIKRGELPGITAKAHLRRRGKFMLPRNANYNSIQPDRIIPEWPEEIKQRSRIGDWEGNTVYGGVGNGLLVTMVDRKSRFLCAALLDSRKASLTKDTIIAMMQGLPVKSISLDNGSEFSEFHAIEQALNTTIYFAEPHKPWQRGTNENTNDILRFFFPKGYDFKHLDPDALAAVVDLINSRPRKCLGWRSPKEIFSQECVALT